MNKNIVILGAGVSGLTTAVSLLREGYKHVTVAAKHVPGDMSSEYTSPWAGASILTVAGPKDDRLQEIDAYSMKEFKRLAEQEPEANIMPCKGIQYSIDPVLAGEDPYWVRKIYKDLKEIPQDQLIPNVSYGYTFETFTATVPKYLQWLVKTLREMGGRLERRSFDSISEAIEHYKDADTIVNCTGFGSYYLTDVKDESMYRIRGQTVLVKSDTKTQHYIDGTNAWTYIIPRNDGTVICGGTVDRVNKNTEPDDAVTKSILTRVYNLHPEINGYKGVDGFEIISVNVGFRPGRENGIRLEKEYKRRSNGDRVTVCHNYGHGSHGYQSSWGASAKLVQLVKTEGLSKL